MRNDASGIFTRYAIPWADSIRALDVRSRPSGTSDTEWHFDETDPALGNSSQFARIEQLGFSNRDHAEKAN